MKFEDLKAQAKSVRENLRWQEIRYSLERFVSKCVFDSTPEMLLKQDETGRTIWLFLIECALVEHALTELLEEFLRRNIHPVSTYMAQRTNTGATALLLAAANEQTKTVEWLLEKGASLTERDHSGATALLLAAANEQIKTVEWLLEKGASLTERDHSGATALLAAAANGRINAVHCLLARGASLTERDHAGQTAVVLAAKNNHLGLVFSLLQKSSLDFTDSCTPFLHEYMVNHGEEIFELILDTLRDRYEAIRGPLFQAKHRLNSVPNALIRFLTFLELNKLSYEHIDAILEKMQRIPEIGFEWQRRKGMREQKASFERKKHAFQLKLRTLVDPNILIEARRAILILIKKLEREFKPVDELVCVVDQVKEPYDLLDVDALKSSRFTRVIKPTDRLFSAINNFLKNSVSLERYSVDETYEEVLKYLRMICQRYIFYRDNICSTTRGKGYGAVSVDDHLKYFQQYCESHRYQFSGIGIESGHLKPEVEQQLAPKEGEDFTERLENVFSRTSAHLVLARDGVHFKYHSADIPCRPGIEYLIAELYGSLTENKYGVAPTALLRLHRHGYSQLIQASQTVTNGFTLLEFFQKHMQSDDNLQKMDAYSFSAMVMLSFATNPQDGKADNYFVQFVPSSEDSSEFSFHIVSIDNDMVLEPPIFAERDDKYRMNVKCIFYFFPQMREAFNRDFYQQFTEQKIELLIIEWLARIQQQNLSYAQLREVGFSEGELKELQLPIQLMPGTVKKIYQVLKKAQSYLLTHPGATHDELFHYLYPAVAKYYREIQQEALSLPSRRFHPILEALGIVYDRADPLRNLAGSPGLEQFNPRSVVPTRTQVRREKDSPSQSLSDAVTEFAEAIDFSTMLEDDQQLVLIRLGELGYTKLTVLKDAEDCVGIARWQQAQETPFQAAWRGGLFKECKLLDPQHPNIPNMAATTIQRAWRARPGSSA